MFDLLSVHDILLVYSIADIIDGYGQSPLHTASKMGHLACVQTLVEHGSDVLAKDNEGLTSANIAYINKHSLCSRYLLMAESTWILASRVATLFREVNVVKKENKELKKSLEVRFQLIDMIHMDRYG